MVDVFISYKRRLRPRVATLAARLGALKFAVWYDASLEAGSSFSEEIASTVRAAKAVVVCWSPDAFSSGGDQNGWVRGEAMIGRGRKVLAPVFFERCELDPPFNTDHVEDMTDWAGDDSPEFKKLISRLGDLCGRPGLRTYPGPNAQANDMLDWASSFPADPLAGKVLAMAAEAARTAEREQLFKDWEAENLRHETETKRIEGRLRALGIQYDSDVSKTDMQSTNGDRPAHFDGSSIIKNSAAASIAFEDNIQEHNNNPNEEQQPFNQADKENRNILDTTINQEKFSVSNLPTFDILLLFVMGLIILLGGAYLIGLTIHP